MATPTLPFATRLWLAWACFFRVLADGAFAGRVVAVRDKMPELPPAPEAPKPREEPSPEPAPVVSAAKPKAEPPEKPDVTPALQLLSLLQREGRLIDFLEQDVAGFSDADVGAAARVVHEGCRKTLRGHCKISPVRAEEEGSKVTIAQGYDPSEVKLLGNVSGKPPLTGTLQHRGWRVTDLVVPTRAGAHDASIVAPAEVELS